MEINENLTAAASVLLALAGVFKVIKTFIRKKRGSEIVDLKELILDTQERVCAVENQLVGINRDLNKLKTSIREAKSEKAIFEKNHYRAYA